jgi:mono/diheme cytochrome c family protein
MKSTSYLGLALLACAGLALAGAPEGKALFASKCQQCHGANGEGKAAIAKMLGATMAPLSSKQAQAHSNAEIKKIITAGQGKMKPVAGLKDAEIDDVIAHVRTLKP